MPLRISRTRLTSGIINPVQLRDAKFNSALYLLPRKEQVEERNTQRLLELAQTTPVMNLKQNTLYWNHVLFRMV